MKLKKGLDRRFKAGHPWAYSNELEGSLKGIEPGTPTRLDDPSGKFLAYGYVNPHSLIAFRTVSRDEKDSEAMSTLGLKERLSRAWKMRKRLGLDRFSFRLAFGEADLLPGLVIDCFRVGETPVQCKTVFAIQAHTAGANRWVGALQEILPMLAREQGDERDSYAVVRNDLSVRKLEGIEIEEPRWLIGPAVGIVPNQTPIWVRSGLQPSEPLSFQCDWFSGQKTGFFLDQIDNISLLIRTLARAELPRKVRILDLCCYVGQWSAQLATFFRLRGIEAEFTLFDASAEALELARENVRASGASQIRTIKGDVLHDLRQIDEERFDVVISDPPGLIKSRKDLPTGSHAYLQLHTQPARLVKTGGFWMACSCSGLFSEDDFIQSLAKAILRNGIDVRWVARGMQSADHPVSASFPEGRYLKSWLGIRV